MIITLLNQDCRTAPLEWVRACDVQISDPPYRDDVHKNATSQSPRRGARHRDLGFDPLTLSLQQTVAIAAANVRRWSVVYSDVEDSAWTRIACQEYGATYIRTLPWVRWSMPQLTGDRPPQGFEQLLLFWGCETGRKSWNGRGSLTHLDHKALRGEEKHKAEKPLDQVLDLVSWFSNPGEVVLDLFAGHATVGLACYLLGRSYLGYEYNPKSREWFDKGLDRLTAVQAGRLSERDVERIRRWLADTRDDESTQDGPAAERKARRDADKQRLREAFK